MAAFFAVMIKHLISALCSPVVSGDGLHRTGGEADVLQGHLLPDPERRAALGLRHHPDDHHVCWSDQPGRVKTLGGRRVRLGKGKKLLSMSP